jgi:hypothetical protein
MNSDQAYPEYNRGTCPAFWESDEWIGADMELRIVVLVSLVMTTAIPGQAQQPSIGKDQAQTKVVLLGTGTPIPDPERSGPATVIAVDDRAYLVDFGPG